MRNEKNTVTDFIGLPHSGHNLWKLGTDHVRTALAICDAFAALRYSNADLLNIRVVHRYEVA